MKPFFTITLLSISFCLHGQIKKPAFTDSTLKQLYGEWRISFRATYGPYRSALRDTITLVRPDTSQPYLGGSWIRIEASGRFVDAYSAGCGNDSKNHLYAGTWELDRKKMILSTSIAIDDWKKKHRINFLSKDHLELIAEE